MSENLKNNIGIIILAAGASNRLGEPKQLLVFNDKTLLQHSIDEASASNVESLIVVLGANAALIKSKTQIKNALVTLNENWQEGMATSIKTGIHSLIKAFPKTESAIIMLCDQPFVSATLINNIIDEHLKSKKAIVNCHYEQSFGPPSLFHNSIFPQLLNLSGDSGAKSIFVKNKEETISIDFPEGIIDVDTQEQYQKIREKENK